MGLCLGLGVRGKGLGVRVVRGWSGQGSGWSGVRVRVGVRVGVRVWVRVWVRVRGQGSGVRG